MEAVETVSKPMLLAVVVDDDRRKWRACLDGCRVVVDHVLVEVISSLRASVDADGHDFYYCACNRRSAVRRHPSARFGDRLSCPPGTANPTPARRAMSTPCSSSPRRWRSTINAAVSSSNALEGWQRGVSLRSFRKTGNGTTLPW